MKKKSTIFPILVALICLLGTTLASVYAQTAIGGNEPNGSAMLDVQSNNKGVLFPRMNTAQRNAIPQAAVGLMIFNEETGCLEINLGAGTASWQPIKCTPGMVSSINCAPQSFNNFPIIPTQAIMNTPTVTINYTGGNGKDHEGQVVGSTGVTGLTATLQAGTFATGNGTLTYTLSGTASAYGTAGFAINIGGQTCTLNVPLCGAYVTAGWKVFSCYNLGSNTSVNPMAPSWEINGAYWQWGNFNAAAPAPSSGSGEVTTAVAGWSSSGGAGDNSWQEASKTANDPCPEKFRVPKKADWEQIIANTAQNPQSNTGTWTAGINSYTAGRNFGAGLFLPAAGYRSSIGGTLNNRNSDSAYWSSQHATPGFAFLLNPTSGGSTIQSFGRSWGTSIRCIAE